MQVIETISVTGSGVIAGDPIRSLYQYWSMDGTLLAERDTLKNDAK